jgi:hypothetical protein
MSPFNLQRFLEAQQLTPATLASSLRVSEDYIRAVLAGTMALTPRDEAGCLALASRLNRERHTQRAHQEALPFAEPPETFTREYARVQARKRGATR